MVINMNQFQGHIEKHRPFWQETQDGSLSIKTLQESSDPEQPVIDLLLYKKLPNGMIRLAVTDPALCYLEPYDTALNASELVLRMLSDEFELEKAFLMINSALYLEGAARATDMKAVCVLAVDWNPVEKTLHSISAGDCQLMIRVDNNWVPTYDSAILTKEGAEAWEKAAPQRDRFAHLTDHDRILGDPSLWLSAPLGQFSKTIVRQKRYQNVDAVALASDGLTLNLDSITDLKTTYHTLHDRPKDWPHEQPHGDIAVLICSNT